MSNDIEIVIKNLTHTFAHHNSIRAIGMSGGERPLPKPGEGDIDLFVYCTEIPTPEQRAVRLALLHGEIEEIEIGKLERGHWGQGDRLSITGVETWLLYFTAAEARSELEETLAGNYLGRLDSYYYPIGRCAMWKTMQVFYDPDGLLQGFKQRLANYPQELAQALIAYHLQALADVEDLERAVERKDVFFFHFALDLALDHFLQALFALNREYFPSRKRSELYLRGFQFKPAQCEERLCRAVSLGGQAETLRQSYQLWKSLTDDLKLTLGSDFR